jgi:hypothetical protein
MSIKKATSKLNIASEAAKVSYDLCRALSTRKNNCKNVI